MGNDSACPKEGLEFGLDDYREIDKFCKSNNISWSASAWDIESQKFLRQFDLSFNKVASAMLPYTELLKVIAEEKRKTFISTGMSTMKMLDDAVEIFRKAGCPFELMHCISTYPMDEHDANLYASRHFKIVTNAMLDTAVMKLV